MSSDWLWGNWSYQYLPPGTYYARASASLASWFGCALNNSCPAQGDWSPTYTFTVTGPTPAKPTAPKVTKDSLYVSEVVEGGANQWIKTTVNYFFGGICLESDPSWPDCYPAPDLNLTVTRLGTRVVRVHKKRKVVRTSAVVYHLSDSGINDGSGGGSMFVPPLIPAVDFIGGAKPGTYIIKVTSDLSGSPSDTALFSISGGRLSDG